MPATGAAGTYFYYGDSSTGPWTRIANELQGIPELGSLPDKIEITPIDSEIKKYIIGRKDLPDVEFEFIKDPKTSGSAWNVFKEILKITKHFKIVFPDGSNVLFSGYPSGTKQPENDGNDGLKFIATIVLESDFVWDDNEDAAALTCAVAAGSASDTTKATATPGGTNTLMIAITRSAQRTPFLGELAPIYAVPYTSASDYPAAADQYIGVYEVDGDLAVQKFYTVQLTASEIG